MRSERVCGFKSYRFFGISVLHSLAASGAFDLNYSSVDIQLENIMSVIVVVTCTVGHGSFQSHVPLCAELCTVSAMTSKDACSFCTHTSFLKTFV